MKRLLLFSGLMIACGSSPPFASDDVAAFDASFDQTVSDATFNDVTAFDVDPDAPKFGGGGPFLCNGCVCDGTLNMCEHFSGGVAPMPVAGDAGDASDFGDASACEFDAGQTWCAAIPIECFPNPSCACVMTHYQSGACTCDIDPSGNGLVVSCMYP